MLEPDDQPQAGAFGAAKGVASSIWALLQKRGELAATEFQEQRHRLIDQLIWVAVVLVLMLMALISGTFLLVVVTWDTGARDWVLAGLTLAYAGGAGWCGFKLRRRLTDSPPPFAATIEEFRKDRAWFQEKS